jgi:hypothetical protein
MRGDCVEVVSRKDKMKAIIVIDEIYPVYSLITDEKELLDSQNSRYSTIDIPNELGLRYREAEDAHQAIQRELEELNDAAEEKRWSDR